MFGALAGALDIDWDAFEAADEEIRPMFDPDI